MGFSEKFIIPLEVFVLSHKDYCFFCNQSVNSLNLLKPKTGVLTIGRFNINDYSWFSAQSSSFFLLVPLHKRCS